MNQYHQRCLDIRMDDDLSCVRNLSLKQNFTAAIHFDSKGVMSPNKPKLSPSERDCAQFDGLGSRLERLDLEVDRNYIQQLCDGNEAFERELFRTFVADTEQHLGLIEQALGHSNFSELEQEAHRLRGACANLGLVEVQAIAEALEHQAQQHVIQSTAAELLEKLHRALHTLQAFVDGP